MSSIASKIETLVTAGNLPQRLEGALKSGHPNRTAKGFTCTRIDPKHYRCVKGAQAYRWDIS